MNDRTVPKIRIFGSSCVGPARGPDFRSELFPVQYVVRIFGPNCFRSGTWSELEPGPVRGTDFGPVVHGRLP